MPRNTAVFAPTFSGESVVRSDDITKDPRYGHNAPRHGMPEGHLPVRSYLAVPVVSRSGVVIGGLFFGHRDAAVFSEHHEHMMVAVAEQASIAFDNAQLYAESRRARVVAETVQNRFRFLAQASDVLAKGVARLRGDAAARGRAGGAGCSRLVHLQHHRRARRAGARGRHAPSRSGARRAHGRVRAQLSAVGTSRRQHARRFRARRDAVHRDGERRRPRGAARTRRT